MSRGLFITLESADGAGKTTARGYILDHLKARGKEVVCTREPGGTPFGEEMRSILLHSDQGILPETELLLFYAARIEHIDKVIKPALEDGKWVISDRFEESTKAYQGAGAGMSTSIIEKISEASIKGFVPDATLVLDITEETMRERSQARDTIETVDRFETESWQFKQRVREYFENLAQSKERRIIQIDANPPIDVVQKNIISAIDQIVDSR